jgi:hypothetical protein
MASSITSIAGIVREPADGPLRKKHTLFPALLPSASPALLPTVDLTDYLVPRWVVTFPGRAVGGSVQRDRRPMAWGAPPASQRLVLALWLLTLISCARASSGGGNGPQPLEGFYAKVAALVTSDVRGRLRDQPDNQDALRAMLPALAEQPTSDSLLAELRAAESVSELADPIQRDIAFEASKPEHQDINEQIESAEVQKQLVTAIVDGMRRALEQLEEDADDT